MDQTAITAMPGPNPGDRSRLSKVNLMTLDALCYHPLSHALELTDIVALITNLGAVEHKSSRETVFRIGREYYRIPKPHLPYLTTADVMAFRHMLSRAGWWPQPCAAADAAADTRHPASPASPAPANLLLAVNHRAARFFDQIIQSSDVVDHAFRPNHTSNGQHHIWHPIQPRDQRQPARSDDTFNERMASSGGRAVRVGH